MTWVLVIFISIGGFSKEEANALTSVPGFATREECRTAASQAKADLGGGYKVVATTCLAQGK
jgi:hypothetical protein